jgi:hypothetical protein
MRIEYKFMGIESNSMDKKLLELWIQSSLLADLVRSDSV